MSRITTWILALACITLAAGCAKVGDVSGRVSYKEKPVTSGTVTMIGKDGVPHQTSIGEDGSYQLKGIPRGEVNILVSSPPLVASKSRPIERVDPKTGQPIDPKITDSIATQAQKDSWQAIPIEYADISQGRLKTTIASGKNAHDIKLD